MDCCYNRKGVLKIIVNAKMTSSYRPHVFQVLKLKSPFISCTVVIMTCLAVTECLRHRLTWITYVSRSQIPSFPNS